MTNRRKFLKTGLVGAIALTAGGFLYRAVQGPPALAPYRLDGAARNVLAAIAPAIIGPQLPAEAGARTAAIKRTVDSVQLTVASLPLTTQKEIQDLFGLLSLAPARRLLAGVPAWEEATPEQVSAFLQDWRTHRFAMLRTAYGALHDLVMGAWYAHPDTWEAIGYPGPIKGLF